MTAESVDPAELELDDLEEGESAIVAYDITLSLDGDEYQPEDGVTVTIENDAISAAIENGSALRVLHMTKDGAEPVDDVDTEGGVLSFTAYGFSVYTVIGDDGYSEGDTARVIYEFYREDENGNFVLWDTQVLKNGDELIEPGIPTTEKPDYFFVGWFEGEDHESGGSHAEITFGPVSIPAGTTQDRTYKYHAHYAVESILVFWNAAATDVIDEKEVEFVDGGVDVSLSGVTPNVGANEGFYGWVLKGEDPEASGTVIYAPDDNYRVTKAGTTELQAVVKRSYKIEFNKNDDGDVTTTFTDPLMVPYGQAPTEPAEPTRTGYSFGGWYTDAACTQEFDWDQVKNDTGATEPEIIQLYAKWNAEYTTYTLYVWREAYDAGGDLSTSHYDLAADFLISRDSSIPQVAQRAARSGDVVDVEATWKQVFESSSYATSERSDTNAFDYRYFDVNYEKTDTSVTIKGDGSTIINVYYDLKEFTMIFNVTTRTGSGWNATNLNNAHISIGGRDYTGTNYQIQVKLGQDISSLWPVEGSARSGNTNYRLASWSSPYESLSFATKRTTVTKNLISNTSGVPQATSTYDSNWTNSNQTTNVNYYLEKVDSTDSTVRANYELDTNLSQSVPGDGNFNPKAIEGFTYNSALSGTSGGGWGGTTTYNFYYYRTTWNLVYHNYAELQTDDQTYANIKFGTDISGAEYRYDPTPEKAGLPSYYRFMGWYTDRSYAEDFRYNFTTMPNGNVALYAKWVPNGIKITFDAKGGQFEGGAVTTEVDASAGSTITAPAAPTRENYSFSHWVVSGSETPVDFSNREFIEDTTIEAVWTTSDEYVVKYERATDDPNHSNLPEDSSKYRFGAHVELLKWDPGLPEEDHFLGWTVKKSGVLYTPGSLFEIENLDADVYETYNGQNNVIVFVATYGDPEPDKVGMAYVASLPEGNADDHVETERYLQNAEFKALSAEDAGFSCQGYEFAGWTTDSSKAGLRTEAEIASMSLIAPGTSIAADEDGAAEVTIGGETVKMNYLYGVWRAGTSEYTVWHMFQDPEDPTEYTKNYLRNGIPRACIGHEHEAQTGSTAEVTQEEIDDFLEEGYTYNSGKSTLTGTVLADGSLELYVYYDLQSYGVTYHYENNVTGEDPSATEVATYDDGSYRYGQKVYFKPDATAPGYEFSGWNVTNELKTGTDSEGRYFIMPHRDANVIGSWSAATNTVYTVEYYFQNVDDDEYTIDGSKTKTLTGTTGTRADAPVESYEGFELNPDAPGTVDSGIITADDPATTVDERLVLKLYYDRVKYDVVYQYTNHVTGESALPTTVKYRFGETVSFADPDPTAPGYTFQGWETTWVKKSESATFVMPARNVTVSGGWKVGKTTFKIESYYMDTSGNYPNTPNSTLLEEAETGSEVSVTPDAQQGFTFDDTAANVLGPKEVKGDGTTTLKVYYARNKYNVSYVYNGHIPTGNLNPTVAGLADYTGEFYYQAEVTVQPDATADDYNFSGWKSDSVTQVVDRKFTMPASDVRFVGSFAPRAGAAKFQIRYYTLKPNDPGTGIDDGEYIINGHEYDLLESTELQGTAQEYAYARDPHLTGYEVDWNDTVASDFFLYDPPGDDLEATVREGNQLKGMIRGDESDPLILAIYLKPLKYKVTYAYASDSAVTPTELLPAAREGIRYGDTVDVGPALEAPAGYTARTPLFWKASGVATDITIDENTGTFTMPNRDVVLYGKFLANEDTQYKVEYWFQNVEGTEYVKDDTKTRTMTGTTGQTAYAPQDTFEGFEINLTDDNIGTKASGVITGYDASTTPPTGTQLVLRLNYDRLSYDVVYHYTNEVAGESPLPRTLQYKFGATVPFADDATAPGYEFSGWETTWVKKSDTVTTFVMPARAVTVNGSWQEYSGEYWVYHYFEQLDGTYSINAWSGSAADPCPGHEAGATTGSNVTVALDTFPGYTHHTATNLDTASGTVFIDDTGNVIKITDANGNVLKYPEGSVNAGEVATEFRIYYDLNKYAVSYEYVGAKPAEAVVPETVNDVKYGDKFDVYANAKDAQGSALYTKGEKYFGYTFLGWETKHEGVEIDDDNKITMPMRNVTLQGRWQANTDTEYKVEHYVQILGKTDLTAESSFELKETETRTATTDSTVTAAPKSSYTGFTFRGDLALSKRSGVVTGDGKLVLKLYYVRNTHDVRYVYEGTVPETADPAANGLGALGGTYSFEETVDFAAPAAAPGYTFSGWKTNFADSNTASDFTMPDRDVSVRGSFTANDTDYTIKYFVEDPNGAGASGYTEKTDMQKSVSGKKTGDEATYDGYDVEIEGYTFEKAEYFDPSKKVTVDDAGLPTQVISLYYKAKTYSVVYRYDNADDLLSSPEPAKPSIYNVAAVPYSKIVELAANATAPGYDFSGWKVKDASGNEVTVTETSDGKTFAMPAANVEVTGHFEPNDQEYVIRVFYMKNDGTYPENEDAQKVVTKTAKTGTLVEVPDEMYDPEYFWDEVSKDGLGEKEHYRTDDNLNAHFDSTTVKPDASDELKVYFMLAFTVTYKDGAEDENLFEDEIHEDLGYGVDTPTFDGTVPDRKGYVADGWEPAVEETVTGDAVYNVKWADDKNEDTTGNKIPDDKEEYTVLYKKGDHGAFTEDVTDKTKFEKLALNGDTPKYAGEEDEYGKPKAEKNYTFKLWRDRRGNDLTEIPATIKAEDSTVKSIITYTAVWADDRNKPGDGDEPGNGIPDDEEIFTVVYTDGVDGEEVFADQKTGELKLGDKTPEFKGTPTRKDYNFSGWNVRNGKPAETVKAEDADKNSVITYTAQWTKKSSGGGTDPVFIDDHVNYIIGYEDGSFRPEGNITRAETSAIFFRLLKEEVRNRYLSDESSYTDVEEEQWFNTYVSTLSEMGIFKGYADGSFLPGNPITRAEFAVIAGRFSSSQMDGDTYKFSDIDDHWAASDIRKAAALGYINGYETGEYKPDKYISRAEAVVVINRMLGRDKVNEDTFKDYVSRINEFNDLSESAWYYNDVVEASNDHDYKKAANGFEIWTRRKPDIDWTKFQY